MQFLTAQPMTALVLPKGGGPNALDEVPFLPLAGRAAWGFTPSGKARFGRGEMPMRHSLRAQTGAVSEGTGLGFAFSADKSAPQLPSAFWPLGLAP